MRKRGKESKQTTTENDQNTREAAREAERNKAVIKYPKQNDNNLSLSIIKYGWS